MTDIQTLIMAVVSTAGFMCSWSLTELKAHVFGILPSFRNLSVEEVEDKLYAQWGTLGKLLNCPYCMSGYVCVALSCLYSFASDAFTLLMTAFLAPSFLISLSALQRVPEPDLLAEKQPTAKPNTQKEEDYVFTAPLAIQKHLLRIKDDPEAHKERVARNTLLIQLLHHPEGCPDQTCHMIAKQYQVELNHMLRAHKKNPQKCPSCMRTNVVNKYFYTLYDHLGEQEVSHQNPKMLKTANEAAFGSKAG